MTRVGVYTRISLDHTGQRAGVMRQEQDCLRICRLRRWKPGRVYEDNDISAYSGKARPEFEQLLTDLTTGSVDGMVVYDLDRLTRQPRYLERLIDIYEKRSGLVFASVQGELNLATNDGRIVARMMVAFANKSSADMGRRLARYNLDQAMKGKPRGTRRAFGWTADNLTLDPDEADQLRRGATALLRGQTLVGLARRWNQTGLPTSLGNPWSHGTVRHLYLNPRLAGLRAYHGEILRHEDGKPVIGLWQPILTVSRWERVRDRILGRRWLPTDHPGRRKYLLSGYARCAQCGSVLHGQNDNRYRTYYMRCPHPMFKLQACGSLSISGPGLVALVVPQVLQRLATHGPMRPIHGWSRAQELIDANTKIQTLMEHYARGQLDADTLLPGLTPLQDQVRGLRNEQLRYLTEHPHLGRVPTPDDWDRLSLFRRRQLVDSVIEAIMVSPGSHRGPRIDPGRVSIVWR